VVLRAHLVNGEAAQFAVGDPAGQAFRGLAEHLGGGAAQDQEPSRASRAVGEDPEDAEESGQQLDLVEHHQVAQGLQRAHGVAQAGPHPGVLQVKVLDGALFGSGHHARQGGLAHLPGADDPHGAVPVQQPPDRGHLAGPCLDHVASIP
jgi:hypothetical protein